MKKKILIIGSTGKLGTKLLDFCYKNSISIDTLICKKNFKKLRSQSLRHNVKKSYCINNLKSIDLLKSKLHHNKFDLIYFLDHGSNSLDLFSYILGFQRNCIFAIANKELLIAGSRFLIKSIKKNDNFFIPLDSEHFSLLNQKLNSNISSLYITASGGPFSFNKKINLNKVSKNQVLSHPKWKMGFNNLIDSSNFINKILEIYELSSIFDINVNKIDFMISKEAFVHSIVNYSDGTTSINCFKNDMLITLIKPLSMIIDIKAIPYSQNKIFNLESFSLEKPNDKRFKIFKYYAAIKSLNHNGQIKFMILNNIAQKLYLDNKLKYNSIIPFIMKNIFTTKIKDFNLNSFNQILKYIKNVESSYRYLHE